MTRDVKVLTSGEEHNVPAPEGIEFYPPRLGSIGEADLYINAERTHAGKADANDELPGRPSERCLQPTHGPAQLQMLRR